MLRSALQRAPAIGLLALGAGAAVLLAWQSVRLNLERACAIDDTPYLALCPEPTSDERRLADLRSRIAANPGDSRAYVQLALLQTKAPGSQQSLQAAARLSPVDPNVTAMQAAHALEQGDWPTAIEPLLALVQYRYNAQAALMLARLIGAGKGDLLAGHIGPGAPWFEQVLGQMANAQAPLSSALPLVSRALDAGALDRRAVLLYVGRLKQAGTWGDAYSLWLTLHGKPLPVLYNAGFDQPFYSDGFDWEVSHQTPSSRAGALVERSMTEKRGAILDIRFTGRAIPVPVVRQQLFLGEGRYRLRGEYMASQLRLEQGMVWTVRCTAASAEAGRSASLANTGGAWQRFEFEFSVPRECGVVATLQLETAAASEATTGTRGRMAFDAFSLQKVGL